jgi:hypothetical protein
MRSMAAGLAVRSTRYVGHGALRSSFPSREYVQLPSGRNVNSAPEFASVKSVPAFCNFVTTQRPNRRSSFCGLSFSCGAAIRHDKPRKRASCTRCSPTRRGGPCVDLHRVSKSTQSDDESVRAKLSGSPRFVFFPARRDRISKRGRGAHHQKTPRKDRQPQRGCPTPLSADA